MISPIRGANRKTILLLHGNAESGACSGMRLGLGTGATAGYRVVRPDMRGFRRLERHAGPTTLEPPDRLIEDFCSLMDHLEIARFHLVGAGKIGGTIAQAFADMRGGPDRLIFSHRGQRHAAAISALARPSVSHP